MRCLALVAHLASLRPVDQHRSRDLNKQGCIGLIVIVIVIAALVAVCTGERWTCESAEAIFDQERYRWDFETKQDAFRFLEAECW